MVRVQSLEEMEAEAARFVRELKPAPDRATIVALTGDLGSGKTTFVKGMAKALGVDEHITSPTFVIEKIYPVVHAGFKKLIHIDAYRLKGAHHLEVLGWQHDSADPSHLICIEWPEMAEIPRDQITHALFFTFIDETTRNISYDS